MDHYVFNQLEFVRSQTLKLAEGVSEEAADLVPDGFRNNIRWHLGHIYVVLERLAFKYDAMPLDMPSGWTERFESGSSPLEAPADIALPTLDELRDRLGSQIARLRRALEGNLQKPVASPYTTSAGMYLETPQHFLSFNLYHEAMHLSTIRAFKRLLSL
ncbi:DinB family protein [Paenibacillus glycinis]|uniref:DinB family protein n=1 Tax=Paenibacillus glycinis TaxID=2697035 RepID=A0ABW9XXC6_9BACL|nr:DinB family protein [Paenibacillus glycinis]NBD27078.1 DinB family protein [Paenibacillus glycinis]